MLKDLAWLALAGGTGALCRYGLTGLVQRLVGSTFPWGTMAVNMLGCFLFGFVWSLAESRLLISTHTRFILLTGFMGAFTTFSSFAFDSGALIRDSQWILAGVNIVVQNIAGLGFLFLGFLASRWV